MIRRLQSNHGEILAEALTALLIAALALSLLTAALSAFTPPEQTAEPPPARGSIYTTFTLGDASYGIEMDVEFDKDGYSYPQN